ncbi:MAG: pseudouridine-5'-phosphate glycosidase [Cyanothece sp. SIO1E1]|nr:pseudouridine-5'-phosphate glycosidase [Cyanothece sp. SIO1E1]
MNWKNLLVVTPEVERALADGQAVVALESTIIAHGMPYPKNIETALRVEASIREEGAIPATIAIMDGHLRVGLTQAELEIFGKQGANAAKVSRRDIPFVLARKQNGATTVASTMIIAAMAGIKIFATGGIGGVHRGATTTLDISADLQELAQTSVAVISAGAKSILDLGLTLEYLETHGVPVIGYQTDHFPAFYTSSSGLGVDYRMDQPAEIAEALHYKWGMGLKGGALIANPIPQEFSLSPEAIEAKIEAALSEAHAQKIMGKALTPFLLSKIESLTEGDSLAANIELVLNNARLGAQIAVELAKKEEN